VAIKTSRWYTTTNLRQAWIVGGSFGTVGLVLLVLALTAGPDWLVSGSWAFLGISLVWLATAARLSCRRRAGPAQAADHRLSVRGVRVISQHPPGFLLRIALLPHGWRTATPRSGPPGAAPRRRS